MKRVCYGIIIPGLIIGAVLYIHIPAKYGEYSEPKTTICRTYVNADRSVFVRALRNTRHLTESSWQHWTAWT